MTYDFSLEACYKSATFDIEFLHRDPFEELGRAVIRAKVDPLFNRTMIEAYEKYIADHNLCWNDRSTSKND